MKMIRNTKGFTLIEIVVVLMIISIGSTIVGSMIVTAIQFNNEGTKENMQKQIGDEIVAYLQEELSCSTAIYIQQNQPQIKDENNNDLTWNQMSVQDSRLYRNNQMVFEDDFYQRNDILLQATLKSSALYITVQMKSDNHIDYQTTSVIALDNIAYGVNQLNDVVITSNSKIYYSKDMTLQATVPGDLPEEDKPLDPDEDPSGTITDYINSGSNNYGAFSNITANSALKKGTLIFNKNDGYWYQLVQDAWIDENTFEINGGSYLRALDPYFRSKGVYFKGEVIIYKESDGSQTYYECLQDYREGNPGPKDLSWGGANFWKELSDVPEIKLTNPIEYDDSEEKIETVVDRLEEDSKGSFVGEYDETKWNQYKVGDMVMITYEAKFGKPYREFYMKIYDYECKPGESDNQGRLAWRLYSKVYSCKSAYAIGDVTGVLINGKIYYRKFIENCDKEYTAYDMYQSNESWFNGNRPLTINLE